MGVALLVILDDPRSSLLSRLLWSIASWSHHSRRPGRHHRVVAKVRFVSWSCWDVLVIAVVVVPVVVVSWARVAVVTIVAIRARPSSHVKVVMVIPEATVRVVLVLV